MFSKKFNRLKSHLYTRRRYRLRWEFLSNDRHTTCPLKVVKRTERQKKILWKCNIKSSAVFHSDEHKHTEIQKKNVKEIENNPTTPDLYTSTSGTFTSPRYNTNMSVCWNDMENVYFFLLHNRNNFFLLFLLCFACELHIWFWLMLLLIPPQLLEKVGETCTYFQMREVMHLC